MSALRSLRLRLAASSALVVLVIVAVAGFALVLQMDARDRTELDHQLEGRLGKVTAQLQEASSAIDPSDSFDDIKAGSGSLVRLIANGEVIAEGREFPDELVAIPDEDGFSTILIEGDPWRSLVGTDESAQVQIQVLRSLVPTEERLAANTMLVGLGTALATVLSIAAGWLIARLVLEPLARLTRGARAIRGEIDHETRLPTVTAPQEVADLSDTLNDMLDRLQRGMVATRRFTADAGHELRTPLASLGAYLEILARNPDLPAERRADVLASAGTEHRRIVDLLEGLQTLARGDAGALGDREVVDVADLTAETVTAARRRHPSITLDLDDRVAAGGGSIRGWRSGLRLAIDNLITNAAVHGRPEGRVRVRIEADAAAVRVSVDDDGPGIAPDDRPAVRERFARGPASRTDGSGLGLALVDQQAALHQGSLTLRDSDLGGLSAVLTLPAAGAGRD